MYNFVDMLHEARPSREDENTVEYIYILMENTINCRTLSYLNSALAFVLCIIQAETSHNRERLSGLRRSF